MGILAKCFGYTKKGIFFFFLRRSRKAFLLLNTLPSPFLCLSTPFVPQNLPRCHILLSSPLISRPLFFIRRNHSIYATSRFCILPPSVELFLFALPFILNFSENATLHWILKITFEHARNLEYNKRKNNTEEKWEKTTWGLALLTIEAYFAINNQTRWCPSRQGDEFRKERTYKRRKDFFFFNTWC